MLKETMTAAVQRKSPEGKVALLGSGAVTLRIVSPTEGVSLLRDLSLPSSLNTIGLRAEIVPAVREVLWMVDGKPYQLTAYPYTVRWPLQVGEHVFQVRTPLANEKSATVHIRVE